ncbi:hypothetical protein GCM10010280_43480 [Streptomyces pilosus]|uniref:Uncharacterized protein n=1 Tax=Streptomyces pilosus TaxID=28893 RepID=A0A918EZQ2_9ACTN|nr:hypothetical protein GCM10010280_43480 [Streptomyces pilosus]
MVADGVGGVGVARGAWGSCCCCRSSGVNRVVPSSVDRCRSVPSGVKSLLPPPGRAGSGSGAAEPTVAGLLTGRVSSVPAVQSVPGFLVTDRVSVEKTVSVSVSGSSTRESR